LNFVALILVCSASITHDDCTPKTALDMLSFSVPNEVVCLAKLREGIAHMAEPAWMDENGDEKKIVVTRCGRKGHLDE
jgi:hypothetical protein